MALAPKKMHFLKVAAQEIIELVLHLDDKVIQAFKIWHWRQSVGRLSQAGVPPPRGTGNSAFTKAHASLQ